VTPTTGPTSPSLVVPHCGPGSSRTVAAASLDSALSSGNKPRSEAADCQTKVRLTQVISFERKLDKMI
jgi:hypothetical protein